MWHPKLSSRRQRSFVHSACLNVFICLSLCSFSGETGSIEISEECKEYLQFVAESSSQFQVCAFLKARPFTVCTGCFKDYAFAYNAIINLKSGRGQVEKNCSEDLLSGDRVSIVNRAFEYVTNTWGIGRCDNCLVVTKDEQQLSFHLADTTKEFQRRSEQLSSCIDLHLRDQSKVCTACMPAFHNLSVYYKELVTKSESKVCMDLLDTMNQTRVEWAQYGCLPVYGLNLEMYLLAVATLILTSMFYLYARLSQKPRDARILEGRTMHHHVSRMSLGSDLSRLDSSNQAGPSNRLRPLIPVAS